MNTADRPECGAECVLAVGSPLFPRLSSKITKKWAKIWPEVHWCPQMSLNVFDIHTTTFT